MRLAFRYLYIFTNLLHPREESLVIELESSRGSAKQVVDFVKGPVSYHRAQASLKCEYKLASVSTEQGPTGKSR